MQVSECWTERLSCGDSLELIRTFALEHCRMAGDAARDLAVLVDNRQYKEIVGYQIDYSDPSWRSNISALLHIRQALGFYTKLEDLDIQVDKEKAALVKFEKAEEHCRLSNELFRRFERGSAMPVPELARILRASRYHIRSVLGKAPSVDQLKCYFGPGASTSIRKIDSNPTNKMAGPLTCSAELIASNLFADLVRSCPGWFGEHEAETFIEEEDGSWYVTGVYDVSLAQSVLSFVPKSCEIFRTTITQATLNGFIQLGIGKWMTNVIRKAGLDLTDDKPNKRAAKEGSITGGIATLDLSSASDLISYGLVKFLLPHDWFELLSGCRHGSAIYKKRSINLEQFSAMGNGYTFPLESLIFWSITRAVTNYRQLSEVAPLFEPRSYGDDIICDVKVADDVSRALELCGFIVNTKKSFTSAAVPFRESCGVDCFLGVDIRPYYQKKLISGQTLFTLHNFYMREGYFDLANAVKRYLPRSLRLYGPDGYGDGHLVATEWAGRLSRKLGKSGYSGVFFETLSMKPRKVASRYPGDFVSPLYSIYTKDRGCVFEQPCPYAFKDCSSCPSDTSAIEFQEWPTAVIRPDMGLDTPSLIGRPLWSLPTDEEDGGEYSKVLIYTFRR